MIKRSSFFFCCSAALSVCAWLSCASLPLLVPNPPRTGDKEEPRDDRKAEKPGRSEEPASAQKLQEKAPARGDDIDFSLAFAEAPVSPPEKTRTPPVVNEPVPVFTESTVGVPTSRIRVAIRQGSVPVSLYVMGAFEVRSASLPQPIESRGRIAFVMNSGSRIALSLADAPSAEVAVPCTLALLGEAALFDFGQESYRGSFHIHGGSKPVLVNHIDMEEYLRGVLPLEMGKVQKEEIEALKAQAVAARTYAYNRIVERVGKPFDVVRTIADQVYGGVTVETSEADAAIAATKGLVLAWQDSLARVYFHSTCGGRTATVNEIWENRPFCSYLSAMDDTDGQGVPYCSISPRFTWKESWSADQVSKILHATVGKTYPGKRFNGRLQAIVVRERLPCGRIQSCILESSAGDAACGGDKLRFVLRRKSATGYLLRSANFEVIENGPDRFTLEGKGYGHGVGMCQMGAIGRAR
ncbi:MAG: SpoIID/LytB domain-containing protein, partial [Chitinispirillaceae bacterium]|nr:SpoIID/LytB domain-containing protein [Chitinispirillaceae bacterium]